VLDVAVRHRVGDLVLDVAFAASGITALTGPSGAGKTTILNIVAGLVRPDAGTVSFAGEVLEGPGRHVPPHRRGFGVAFQDHRLFPHLTVRQNLLYGAWFRRAGRGRLDEVTGLLGIGPLLTRRPRDLSGGERQRVALGRALLMGPRMLILDEPLAALDPARKAEVLPWLRAVCAGAGVPILYVSHAMDEITALAASVLRIEAGHVV
jgi:molybdate transport system ATP-binding protein